jgi:PII-like signaling protein
MTKKNMTMARIYMSEETAHVNELLTLLHDKEKVKGVTVFRGIGGYGDSGHIHSSHLIGLSMNLPIVVEFFDEDEKMNRIIDDLSTGVKPGHIVSWQINLRN